MPFCQLSSGNFFSPLKQTARTELFLGCLQHRACMSPVLSDHMSCNWREAQLAGAGNCRTVYLQGCARARAKPSWRLSCLRRGAQIQMTLFDACDLKGAFSGGRRQPWLATLEPCKSKFATCNVKNIPCKHTQILLCPTKAWQWVLETRGANRVCACC